MDHDLLYFFGHLGDTKPTVGNKYLLDIVRWLTKRNVKLSKQVTRSSVRHPFSWIEKKKSLYCWNNIVQVESSRDVQWHNFLSFQWKAPEFASGIFKYHLKMSDWHLSSHPVDLTSSSPSKSLKGRAYTSHLISLHVKREFCFLNAFAMSSTWDLQIHLRSWFAHHCWMQDSVERAQLSVGSEARCQSAPPCLPPYPWISWASRFWGK